LSTLTKVLIVLLTLFSIFLCGIVVTYVASANNYKVAYENLLATTDALKENVSTLKRQLNEQVAAAQQMVDEMKSKISELEIAKTKLQIDVANKERSCSVLQERVNSWTGVVKGFKQAISDMEESLKLTRKEMDNLRGQQVDARKKLGEVTARLNEKMVELDALSAEKRRLLEEKTLLEKRLSELEKKVGATGVVTKPVTPLKDVVRLAPEPTRQVELKGLVTDVNLKNHLVAISIGTADGVKEGMRFHITRADTFICDVLITDVDTEMAAGVIERIVQPPKIGDNVSTW